MAKSTQIVIIPDWIKKIKDIPANLHEEAEKGDATAQYLLGRQIELAVKRSAPGSKEFMFVMEIYKASATNGEKRAGNRKEQLEKANHNYHKESSEGTDKTLTSRVKRGASTVLHYVSSTLAHPITTVASRIATIATTVAVPPVAAVVVAAQVVSIGFRTAQIYRKKQLEEREKLLEKLEEITTKRAEAETKLKIPTKTKAPLKIQYEKEARASAKTGMLKNAFINFGEDLVPIVSDMISTHGISLGPRIAKLVNDTWMSAGAAGIGSEVGSGVIGSRKLEMTENDIRREYLQYLSSKHGVPDYGKDTEKLRQYVEQQYRETKALEYMASNGEKYNQTLHQMRSTEATSKEEPLLQPKSQFKLMISSIREAVVGTKDNYVYIKKAWELGKSTVSAIKHLMMPSAKEAVVGTKEPAPVIQQEEVHKNQTEELHITANNDHTRSQKLLNFLLRNKSKPNSVTDIPTMAVQSKHKGMGI